MSPERAGEERARGGIPGLASRAETNIVNDHEHDH